MADSNEIRVAGVVLTKRTGAHKSVSNRIQNVNGFACSLLPKGIIRKKKRRTHKKRFRHNRHYRDRIKVLNKLGFNSYAQYTSSDLWRSIRSQVFHRDHHRCRLCHFFGADHVHHIDYDENTMRGDNLESLISVCKSCHYKIEFDRKGQKRHLGRARGSTFRRLRNSEK